jgi:hypothetical protein
MDGDDFERREYQRRQGERREGERRESERRETIRELGDIVSVVQEMGRRLADETHGEAYEEVRRLNLMLHEVRLQIERIEAART